MSRHMLLITYSDYIDRFASFFTPNITQKFIYSFWVHRSGFVNFRIISASSLNYGTVVWCAVVLPLPDFPSYL